MYNGVPDKVDIPNYEGKYYVTPDGEVFNSITGRKLKVGKGGKRYRVHLIKDGKVNYVGMGWIMRTCFFGGKEGCLIHKDKLRSNFAYYNLKLVSASEAAGSGMSSRKAVIHVKPNGEEDIYESAKAAAKALYVSEQSISRWCLGLGRNTLVDGKFYYEDDVEEELN